eukprot:g14838.t1
MVKTRQGWVLQSPLELLAVEVVGRATSAVDRVTLAVGGATSAGKSWMVVAAASSMSVLSASEMEAAASATVSMALAVPEVVYRAAADVTSSVESVGAPKVATWPMVAGT